MKILKTYQQFEILGYKDNKYPGGNFYTPGSDEPIIIPAYTKRKLVAKPLSKRNDEKMEELVSNWFNEFDDVTDDYIKNVWSKKHNINMRNSNGETLMMLMWDSNSSQRALDCVKILIKLGADMKIKDIYGDDIIDRLDKSEIDEIKRDCIIEYKKYLLE
jgi:hypothetical protein